MYGIWNSYRKEGQFGICEPTEDRAYRALFKKIGKDAYKWRFRVRRLPEDQIKKALAGKQRGLKQNTIK